MDPFIELAKLFKEGRPRENGFDNFIVGTIINPTPNPKIQIEDEIFLEAEDLYFTSSASYLKGEQVILIPSKNAETYLVVGKVVQYNVSR